MVWTEIWRVPALGMAVETMVLVVYGNGGLTGFGKALVQPFQNPEPRGCR